MGRGGRIWWVRGPGVEEAVPEVWRGRGLFQCAARPGTFQGRREFRLAFGPTAHGLHAVSYS